MTVFILNQKQKKLNYKEWIQYLLVLYDIICDKQVVSISLVI